MNYSILKSRTFWSAAITVAYNFFASVVPLYPNVPWISTVVDLLGIISTSYFHVAGVTNAAVASSQASLSAGTPTAVSGQ